MNESWMMPNGFWSRPSHCRGCHWAEANIETSVNHLSMTRTFALDGCQGGANKLSWQWQSQILGHAALVRVICDFSVSQTFFFFSIFFFKWMCLIKLQWPHGTKKYTTLHIQVHAFWMVRNLGLSEVKRRAILRRFRKLHQDAPSQIQNPKWRCIMMHDVSTAYLQCILCTVPKWSQVHQNILKTQAWGTKDQTHWTRIHAYGYRWCLHCSGSANLSTSPGCQKLVGQISAWDNVDQ